MCRNQIKRSQPDVPDKGGPEKEKQQKSEKGQKFFIFRCAADKKAPGDSALSAYILKEGKQQLARTGFFTTLNAKMLRISNANAECTLGET